MNLKPIILSLCCLTAAVSASASGLPDQGYYRVFNHMSSRYVYVLDDKGKVDMGASSAELKAIELWTGSEKTVSDPATVLYFIPVNDKEYDVTTQGTGIHKIINYYVSIRAVSSLADTYLLYATNSGMTKYLCDGERVLENEQGALSDSGEGQWRYWTLEKISADSDHYFGVKPDITCADGGRYASFFAEFPFAFASEGMKARYVSKVDSTYGIAVVSEVDGAVPAATPVIISCVADTPSGNRLEIGANTSVTISDNCLEGVYFLNHRYLHENRIANDKSTMRVAGLLPDGKLGFVISNDEYLPRNKAYLKVPAGTPENLTIMTPEEYDEFYKAGICDVAADRVPTSTAIYNMMGVKVGDTGYGGADNLPSGLYIVAGRKVYINR